MFKVGDVVEWDKDDQWEIISETGNDYDIKKVKQAVPGAGCSVGHVLRHPKGAFRTAILVSSSSTTPVYTSVLKVGDKLEVVAGGCHGTTSKPGDVLTVLNADGHDRNYLSVFHTDTGDPKSNGIWRFVLKHITDGSLRILANAITNVNKSIHMPVMEGVAVRVEKKSHNCQCGAHAVKDYIHSDYCPEYKVVWRNA